MRMVLMSLGIKIFKVLIFYVVSLMKTLHRAKMLSKRRKAEENIFSW